MECYLHWWWITVNFTAFLCFYIFLYRVKCSEDCVCFTLSSYLCNCSNFFMPAWPPPASECFCWRLKPPDPTSSNRPPPPAAFTATCFWRLLSQTPLTFAAATSNKKLTLNAAWFKSTPSTTLEMIVFDWKWGVLEEACWLICVYVTCVTNICTSFVWVPVEQSSFLAGAREPAVSRARWRDRQTENQAPIQ